MKLETIEMANRNFAASQISQTAGQAPAKESEQPKEKRFGPLASIALFALSMLLWMATIMMLNAGIQGMVVNWLALAAAFIGAQVTLFAAQY